MTYSCGKGMHDYRQVPGSRYSRCTKCSSTKTVKTANPNPGQSSSYSRYQRTAYRSSSSSWWDEFRRTAEQQARAREYARQDAARPSTSSGSSKPVQLQIIEFVAGLAKTQSLGFSDGEVLTMWNLGLKRAREAA